MSVHSKYIAEQFHAAAEAAEARRKAAAQRQIDAEAIIDAVAQLCHEGPFLADLSLRQRLDELRGQVVQFDAAYRTEPVG